MTRNFKTIVILSALVFGLLIGANNLSAATLATTLKGKILLQVEQNGEAWYVNPTNSLRYYLGRPADAFNVMRELGLGISSSDFDSFNGYAPSRLSGRILLKVADNGRAYYVNPGDLRMYYLGRPADAFNVMRELGLGITDKNLGLISIANNKILKVFEETVNKSDFSTASKYFADNVYVVLEGSSCCGEVAASRAKQELERINGLTFTFNSNDAVVKEYIAYVASQYPDRRLIKNSPKLYFDEYIIGVESDVSQQNKAAIGYQVSNGKIINLFVDQGRDR